MRRVLTAAVCSAVLLGPKVVQAQACFGVPSSDGQYAISGGLGLTEGSKSYGVNVSANLRGPLTVGAGYSMLDIDDVETNGNSFGAGAAVELKNMSGFSLCPTARVSYTRLHEEEFGVEGTVTLMMVPIGFGVGRQFPAGPNFNVTLYGEPQFLYLRTKISVTGIPGGVDATESDNQFGMDLGIRVGNQGFFAGATIGFTTIEDSDPTIGIGLGFLVGGRR